MCVFCKIIQGEIPASVIYEDDEIIAILDISQITDGHTLVLPKKHYTNLLEVPDDLAGRLTVVAMELTRRITSKLSASGCNIVTNINEIAGQSVFHAHLHVIPRYPGDQVIIKGKPQTKTPLELENMRRLLTS